MKRYILFLAILIFSTASAQQCNGDANSDSIVNILDVVVMVGYVLGNNELTDSAYENADSNNDGSIDILDIVNIVNIILIGESECPDSDTPLDLSLDWETEDDLSYFDFESLESIVNQLDDLSSLYGIIMIHRGKIIEEKYYGPGGLNVTFNIFSVTKSFISTLIGQAIDQGFIGPTGTTAIFIPTNIRKCSYNVYWLLRFLWISILGAATNTKPCIYAIWSTGLFFL